MRALKSRPDTCKNCNNHYDLVERKWDNKKPAGGVCGGPCPEHRPYWIHEYMEDGYLSAFRPGSTVATQVVKCEWCRDAADDDDQWEQYVYDTELKVWAPLSAYTHAS